MMRRLDIATYEDALIFWVVARVNQVNGSITLTNRNSNTIIASVDFQADIDCFLCLRWIN